MSADKTRSSQKPVDAPQGATADKPAVSRRQGAARGAVPGPVMLLLSFDQLKFLDDISTAIRFNAGKSVKRAALVRAVIDALREKHMETVLERATSEDRVKDMLKTCISVRA